MRRKVQLAAGFTLIELLVVVAIISILAALLLPVLSRAKERGKRAVCASNLHQTALAFLLYAEEDSGLRYPSGWLYLLGPVRVPYVFDGSTLTNLMRYGVSDDVNKTVLRCPSAKAVPPGWFSNPSRFAISYYAIQTDLKPMGTWYIGKLSPTRIGDPMGPLIADRVDQWPSDPTWRSSHTGYGGFSYGNDGYNQAFSDGHVTWYGRSAFPAGAPTAANSWKYFPSGGWSKYFWVE